MDRHTDGQTGIQSKTMIGFHYYHNVRMIFKVMTLILLARRDIETEYRISSIKSHLMNFKYLINHSKAVKYLV